AAPALQRRHRLRVSLMGRASERLEREDAEPRVAAWRRRRQIADRARPRGARLFRAGAELSDELLQHGVVTTRPEGVGAAAMAGEAAARGIRDVTVGIRLTAAA